MDDFGSSSRFHHQYYNFQSNRRKSRDFDDDDQRQQQQQLQDQMEESSNNNNNNCSVFVEKEHMFDKVVTPSDVGKLNRLVIPKQHAEKYFPLDSSSNEKGLLLNFEDRCGKLWRFRYSYWTSSQSYVMTKGWSRFVKDKKLDAGDIVSFQRPLSDNKDRFFIDWRRRPPHTPVDASFHFHHGSGGAGGSSQFLPHQHFQFHGQWNNPVATPLSLHRDHVLHLPHNNHNNNVSLFHNTYNHHYHHHHNRHLTVDGSYGGASVFYHLRSPVVAPPQIEAVPGDGSGGDGGGSGGIGKTVAAAKTLRLFGVNMECAVSEEFGDDECDIVVTTSTTTMSSSSSSPSQFHVYNGMPMLMPMSMQMQMPMNNNNIPTMDFFEKGKSSMSSSFDFGT